MPGALPIVALHLLTAGFVGAVLRTTPLYWSGPFPEVALALASLFGIGALAYGSSLRHRPVLAQLWLILCWVALIAVAFRPLGLIVAELGRANPLWDARFDAADRALGFDWMAMFAFAKAHPVLATGALYIYDTLALQQIAVPVLLVVFRQHRRVQVLLLAAVLALIAAHVMAWAMPALGAYAFHGLDPTMHPGIPMRVAAHSADELVRVRDGLVLDLDRPLLGLVCFPSYHAAAAALFAWGLWSLPRLRWVGLALEAAVLAATPLQGSHYLVDVLAGMALAGASIWAANRMRTWSVALCRGDQRRATDHGAPVALG